MIDLNFGDDEESGGFEDSIPERAPEHGFFVSNMFDDVGGDPGGDGEGEVDEEDGSLTEVFVSVVVVEFSHHVLQRVERGEHDHETHTQIGHPKILLAFCETVLFNLGHFDSFLLV